MTLRHMTVASMDLIEMLTTDCSGETRLALHVPSSSCAGKLDHHYHQHLLGQLSETRYAAHRQTT